MKMNLSTMASATLLAAVAGLVGTVQAATSYVVPWYVNPSLKAQVRLSADESAFVPRDLNLGPDGRWLAVTAASGLVHDMQVLSMAALTNSTPVVTNLNLQTSASGLGFASAPYAASRTGQDGVFFVDPAGGKAVRCDVAHRRWTGRYAPAAVSVPGLAPSASAFAFDAAGTTLWTAARDAGALAGYACGEGAVSASKTVATGCAGVGGFALWTRNGVGHAVVGSSSAADASVMRLVNLETGAGTVLIDDAAHLTAPVRSVRMSHRGDFRPRVYALLETGDIAVYFLKPETSPMQVVWSKTLANADLLAAANAPWSGEHATVTAFEVTPDGAAAVLGYARRADDETAAGGPVRLSVLKHKPRKWTIYEVNDAGNPYKGVRRCLSDGVWRLMFTWDSSGGIYLGNGNQTSVGSAWLEPIAEEFLDLSSGYAYKASDNSAHEIRGNNQHALSTAGDTVVAGKGPRVLLHSPTIRDFSDRAKGWAGGGNFEEVVIDAPNLTSVSSWSGPGTNTLRLIYNFRNVTTMPTWMIYPNNGYHFGAESRWEDMDMSSVGRIGYRTWMNCDATGVLSAPKATSISNECFYSCRYMTGAKIGFNGNTLQELNPNAFNGSSRLRHVTLGGVEGFLFKAGNVFTGCPLEEVAFTGGRPAFADGVTVAWPDTAARQIVFAVPRGRASWEEVLADRSKVTPLTLDEQRAYRAAHPGTYVPYGVLDKSVLLTRYDQYVAYDDMKGGCRLAIDRDTFFDDAVEVSSDWAPADDGTYLPGTVVTLKAKPGATGTFRKWYGDVARADEAKPEFSFAITNDVWIYARFVHPWTLASDRRTASNGNFTVNCSVASEADHTLKLATTARFGLYADSDDGTGVCDLGGPVLQAGDARPWTFRTFNVGSSSLCSRNNGKGDADVLITPGTMTYTFSEAQCLHTGGVADARSLKALIVDEPAMAGTWGGWITCGNYDLDRLVLRIPLIHKFNGDGGLWDLPLAETKFDWWDLSGVTNITSRAFGGVSTWSSYAPATGRLSLPALRELKISNAGLSASEQSPLSRLQRVESVSLGGRDRETTVLSVCDYAFQHDKALRQIVIHNDAAITFGKDLFVGGRVPDEIVFTGRVPAADVFADLLAAATVAETKPVRVYASSLMGWDKRPAYLDAPTEAERAEAPGEVVLGVYRGGAAAPLGKALVLQRKSPFDPHGTALILR